MRNRDYINNDHYIDCLSKFIDQEYKIKAVSVKPAARGYYGETWRLDTAGNSYFLKLDYSPRHQSKYKNSLAVIDYLCSSGIDFISRIVKTKAGASYSLFNSAVLGVFEWIDGKNVETDDTKKLEYMMLGKVYAASKPGFKIPHAVFTGNMASEFFTMWEQLKAEANNGETQGINNFFEKKIEILKHYASRLEHFAGICNKDMSNFYFTHGDAGGNLLIGTDANYISDWDEVMYAPPERDAWVMCCREWAVKLFNAALRNNNIDYELRPERLAFYCYHMFFYYLVEFLKGFTKQGMLLEIEDYFNSWIMERMEYAESIF